MNVLRKFRTSYAVYLFETEASIYKKPHPMWGFPPVPRQCCIPVAGSVLTYSLRELNATGRILLHPCYDPTLDFPEDQCVPLDAEDVQAYANAHGV